MRKRYERRRRPVSESWFVANLGDIVRRLVMVFGKVAAETWAKENLDSTMSAKDQYLKIQEKIESAREQKE